MNRLQRIQSGLQSYFSPSVMGVENESHHHNVPPNSETHFKVLLVSEKFSGLGRVARQRLVNEVLSEEFKTGLHALTQMTLTPEEYEEKKGSLQFVSPECLGGSKK